MRVEVFGHPLCFQEGPPTALKAAPAMFPLRGSDLEPPKGEGPAGLKPTGRDAMRLCPPAGSCLIGAGGWVAGGGGTRLAVGAGGLQTSLDPAN